MCKLILLIIFILINLINCHKPTKKIISCQSDTTVCYKKMDDQLQLEKVQDRVINFNNLSSGFEYLIKFTLKPPLEFENNKYGNPFPIMNIELNIKKAIIKNDAFLKLKNKNKHIPTAYNSSLLEGNFTHPFMVIIFPTKAPGNFIQNYIVHSSVLESRSALNFVYFQGHFEFQTNQCKF